LLLSPSLLAPSLLLSSSSSLPPLSWQMSLRLPAVVTGRPQPTVKWTKDETDPDPERVQVETEGKNTTLFIKVTTRADHGKYTITGTNSSGSKSAETRVDVMGESRRFRLGLDWV
uniref:Ig-like domain-containing protein n=1 Tax=Periophthalmus magnuspinnatus TaxID=409849 RepID=A0A3B4ADW7_9GOBI